ncbi:MAG: hypothetical protein GY859_12110 [Desulfobacterales bacterium]|nr:hypothetical protein [Desulfobacterales bacterium]
MKNLQSNDEARLRVERPLMIGRSALGEALLDEWKRRGWGDWIFLENDGLLAEKIEKHVRPKIADGFRMSFSLEHISRPDKGKGGWKADLIMDVCGEASVRRMLAGKDMPRCGAMFFTPRAAAGVLLLEDPIRRLKLDHLEAQCYRSLIHLAADGVERAADCHDFPKQIPLEAFAPLSDALGRKLPGCCAAPLAAIVLCRYAPGAREAAIHVVKPHGILEQTVLGWRIVWDNEAERSVLKMRFKESPRETGGVILGCVDQVSKKIYIVDFRPPPEDSERRRTYFKRGWRGVAREVKEAEILTGGVVSYVGEWHSHPDAMFPVPGVKDTRRLAEARDRLGLTGHPPVILIIGENDIRFHLLNA